MGVVVDGCLMVVGAAFVVRTTLVVVLDAYSIVPDAFFAVINHLSGKFCPNEPAWNGEMTGVSIVLTGLRPPAQGWRADANFG